MRNKHIVIGMGEVGQAIQKVFSCDWVDVHKEELTEGEYSIMHICLPYNDDFAKHVDLYKKRFQPKHTVIHSTVPVGTSRKLDCLHSPIRGIHPNLYEGVMTFEKFIGGSFASEVADDFRKAGLKVILCDSQETTESMKLFDTLYYGLCIEFAKDVKKYCDEGNLNFHEVYTLPNLTYNSGYTNLGHPEFVRPVLQPIMTKIRGHCVLQNAMLLDTPFTKMLLLLNEDKQ